VQLPELSGQPGCTEYWTVSRLGLASVGSPAVLRVIARQVGLPRDAVIDERSNSAVLGLWGDALAAYQQWRYLGRDFLAA
jgi:hypothetical protein